MRRLFTENALYWLLEYRFDGLRFDAAHAISEPHWLDEMAAEIRTSAEAGRHVHLMLERVILPVICAAISMRNGMTICIMRRMCC